MKDITTIADVHLPVNIFCENAKDKAAGSNMAAMFLFTIEYLATYGVSLFKTS